MPALIDIVGRAFGRLTVVANTTDRKNGRRQVICDCECGNSITCDPRSLTTGHTQSCGCFHKERAAAGMKGRCSNPKNRKYKDYGGRGIQVCEAWDSSYEAFLADMGRAPSPAHTIERDDVNGDYVPSNCRWATPLEQARNKRHHRRVEYRGRATPLSEACELAGVSYSTALWRLNTGKHWNPLPRSPASLGPEDAEMKGATP